MGTWASGGTDTGEGESGTGSDTWRKEIRYRDSGRTDTGGRQWVLGLW